MSENSGKQQTEGLHFDPDRGRQCQSFGCCWFGSDWTRQVRGAPLSFFVPTSTRGNEYKRILFSRKFCAKVFPLRGKLLNVREMNQKSLAENKEALANFKQSRVKRTWSTEAHSLALAKVWQGFDRCLSCDECWKTRESNAVALMGQAAWWRRFEGDEYCEDPRLVLRQEEVLRFAVWKGASFWQTIKSQQTPESLLMFAHYQFVQQNLKYKAVVDV